MKIEKKTEYNDLVIGDKVLLQNHNKSAGVVIFKGKSEGWVLWETPEGVEVYEEIAFLKEKKTKIIGIIK